MKKLLALLLFALPCMGQNPLFITSSFNTATAATPTFSPAAGAVANPTTVTASSTTTGTGCTIYFDTSPTPTTAQTTYSVTTAVTLYAQVRGCSGYNNSAVASAAYTIVVPFVVSASAGNIASTGASSFTITIPSTTAGNSLLYACTTNGTLPTFSPSGTAVPTAVSEAGGLWIASNISGGITSVTVNVQAYKDYACEVAEVAGLVTSSPVDVSTGLASTGYGTSASTGSVTTTNARDVIIGYFLSQATPGTITAGSGYTAIGTSTLNPYATFLEYKLVSSTGSYNPGLTFVNIGGAQGGTAGLELQ